MAALIRGGRGEIWMLHLCDCGEDWQLGRREEEERGFRGSGIDMAKVTGLQPLWTGPNLSTKKSS